MTKSESIAALAAALATAQGKIKGAIKDSANPFFKSKYADLASVWDACREPLSVNGIAVLQSPRYADGLATVTTLVMHKSGEWVSDDLSAPVKDTTPQAIGSAITYLRRYALSAVAGVAPEDDDGEAAMGRKQDNGHDKGKEAVDAGHAAKLIEEFRAELQDAKEQSVFDATCAKIKLAVEKKWISGKQREDLGKLAAQIQGGLVPKQASK